MPTAFTVLMDYGSLTYTPMQNRISPSMCNAGNQKSQITRAPFKASRKPVPAEEDPLVAPVHLLICTSLRCPSSDQIKARRGWHHQGRLLASLQNQRTTVLPLRVDPLHSRISSPDGLALDSLLETLPGNPQASVDHC